MSRLIYVTNASLDGRKVVFSRTLVEVATRNTRLERDFDGPPFGSSHESRRTTPVVGLSVWKWTPEVFPGISDVERLAHQFVACDLPRGEWTHEAHLTIGMWLVDRHGPDEALSRLRDGIRRLNDSHGTVNSSTSGYHETITRAYVHLLSEFIDVCAADMSLSARHAALLGSPLADKGALLKFYSKDRLTSARARTEWFEPDLAPLRLATVFEADRTGA